ncbi:TonB-dependent receptor domain-containing protein [Sphingomonas rubra]|uniref:TonB-dependent Receptor Plug Domain n=1 Tax=Sphingomonas rubra TaxID=634430 RepID=A0A1I5RH32_9SPHN|nr:TonB-dependent receptor [Sphingomonas rubra]SFP57822.1 TonB-dependent Receptor Plug Domain [Sphingomonas rubra]
MIRSTKLLATAAGAALAMGMVQPVSAQTTPTPEESAADETIVVTGTRIQQPGLASNSPITAVDAQEVRLQGATNIESVLNRLPQVTPDANDNVSNGSDGTARINLRNLGSQRNLVLINGQRMLPVQANDVNFIPAALIRRVDVVTGGASAVYGSDAISGVVNFIMRNDLNGFSGDVQYGLANHRNDNDERRSLINRAGFQNALPSPVDGQRFDANIAFGQNIGGGKGNITTYLGYRRVQPINQANRDVSACALDPVFTGTPPVGTGFTCGGSINNEFGYFQPISGPNEGTAFNNTRDGQKTWVPYDSSFRYNYAPLNFFQRDDERFTFGAFGKYEIVPAAEIYGSAMFMKDHTFSQVAPSALFLGFPYQINCDNPLLGAQQGQLLCGAALGTNVTQDVLIGARPVGGQAQPRRNDINLKDARFSAGLRGKIAEGISYDVSGLYAQVLRNDTYLNDIDPFRANRALQVVNRGGTPTCKSVIDGTDPACVPIDIFRLNGISAEGFDYIYVPTVTRGRDEMLVFTGTVSTDLTSYGIKLPWAEQGIAFVVGAEHRRESLKVRFDDVGRAKGSRDSQGRFNVTEAFTEVRVPIASDRPFFHELSLTGGYRYSDYSTAGGVSTYKGEASWAPVRDLRLRGSYNRAIRAPNVSELFGPISVGNVSAQDPCSGASPTASREVCALTGVTAAQYGRIIECPTALCSGQFGGNLALKPETADTYTAGAVIEPHFVPRLSLSVDYFNIRVRDYISSIDPFQTINQCQRTGDPFFCGLFRRDPRTGTIFGADGYIISTTQNTGSLRTSGIDLGLNYAVPTGIGRFSAAATGTWLNELVTQPLPGLGSYDCKGLFGPVCGQPQPEWRHQARLTWSEIGQLASLSLNWRYIGPVSLTNNTDIVGLSAQRYAINARLPSYNYFDLAGTMKLSDEVVLRAGVNNMFDKDPPAIAQGLLAVFGNGNTYPGVYDVVGRYLFVGINAQF